MPSNNAPSTSPVLIVGAGPAGLVTALTLLKNGVPVRIIQKDAEYHIGQRGPGIQPRSMELYNYLGVLPDLMEAGQTLKRRCAYEMPGGIKPAKIFDLIPYAEPTPAIPYRNGILMGQAHYEEILRSHLAKNGVFVELNTELVGFEQTEDKVTAHIVKRIAGEEIHETAVTEWMIGADGGKSVVRKQLGLTFLGVTKEHDRIIVGDIEVKGLSMEYWHSWGHAPAAFVDLRPTEYENVFALLTYTPAGLDPLLQSHDALVTYLKETTNRTDIEFGKTTWLSEYRPNIRMVNKFGEGRVYVVGDAAHVHSPAGGQGMNSSVQDAFNLGWKLSLVYKGVANTSLLDTYTEERLPVIAEMLGRTSALFEEKKAARANNFKDAKAHPKVFHQLGVNCRWSSIVVDEQPGAAAAKTVEASGAYLDLEDTPTILYAGDRAPDAPGLVRVGGDANETTSLFKTFDCTRHTALLFTSSLGNLEPVLEALKICPAGFMQTVAILPQASETPAKIGGVDLTMVDKDGHASAGYPPAAKGYPIVLVRPDGTVGAVVRDAEGVKQYLEGVFAA
ncbi:hypothetical protein PHLCEN_2v11392 [Hermanssonia centrifuga]|uniref:FAD-binding domain-containing protein n=1 Tax=Hermanssonia centrifuga TaxID=98765 RepID=A0A2R6NK09_9APHY|nr:hypothetical protein PHLCEN_2v11392 [Hermanssonia centrifuga]